MAAFFRALGFLASAIGIEFYRGIGVAAFLATLLIVWRRWPLWLLPVVVAGGAITSLLAPDGNEASGKVLHGLSNIPFVAMVYVVITIGGYAVGRAMRRLQS